MKAKKDETQEKKKGSGLIDAAIAGGQYENVQRYGSAAHQYVVAYTGENREKGEVLRRGLKKIGGYKINDKNSDANINQQAGFAAEVMTTAKENAEKIINGEKPTVIRTDDMQKQVDASGNPIGGMNDQLYDIAEVDANGIYVEGTARQLKFVGGSPKECADKLISPKYEKYIEAGAQLEVPSDYYDGVKQELEEQSEKLKKEIETAKAQGKSLPRKEEKLKRIEKVKENLRKGKLTKDEAIKVRLHPKLETAKNIGHVAHRAGVEGAKGGAIIGGGISFIQNAVAVIKGDKKPGEASLDVVKDTAVAGGMGYATNFVGAALKGGMQNASSGYTRALSQTNLPATVVSVLHQTGVTLHRYAKGEIDGTECLTELGEKGTGMLASSMYAVVGQAMIPIPVLGGMIGGMIGYAMTTGYYRHLIDLGKNAKLAHEERLRIEAECAETIRAIRSYRVEMELVINNYLQEYQQVFDEALADMEVAEATGDVDDFMAGANRITRNLGGRVVAENKEEFDALMNRTDTIKL